MKVEASFVLLHSPLFFAGRNWGNKLDVKDTAKAKLQLTYDRETKELEVKCLAKTMYMPSSNIIGYEPLITTLPTSDAAVAPGIIRRRTAQASTPMDHVHAGLGAGKTND